MFVFFQDLDLNDVHIIISYVMSNYGNWDTYLFSEFLYIITFLKTKIK